MRPTAKYANAQVLSLLLNVFWGSNDGEMNGCACLIEKCNFGGWQSVALNIKAADTIVHRAWAFRHQKTSLAWMSKNVCSIRIIRHFYQS
ncbi:hypothetical protein P775_09960 [Puniceibacterium antarcticum]|uniref:Uncharacterized protein n=1 Tax=Puniceibacterium antarcticum TaxID=1206336 RepID=A0A2G8RF92_9RHOB|nr:hypothetical protein P775_09960 [Puniceibacterium antarcticum]